MRAKQITAESENEAALQRIDEIFHALPGTPEGAELEQLARQVEEYKDRVYPIGPSNPNDTRAVATNRWSP